MRGEVPGAAEESKQAGRGAGAAPQGRAQCSPAHGVPLACKGGGEGRARTGSLARGDGHRAGPARATCVDAAVSLQLARLGKRLLTRVAFEHPRLLRAQGRARLMCLHVLLSETHREGITQACRAAGARAAGKAGGGQRPGLHAPAAGAVSQNPLAVGDLEGCLETTPQRDLSDDSSQVRPESRAWGGSVPFLPHNDKDLPPRALCPLAVTWPPG